MKKDPGRRYSLRVRMMVMNLGIAAAALVICGGLFLLSVTLLVEKYTKNDLNFLLTEVCNNADNKITFMEEVIYRIRESQELMRVVTSGSIAENRNEDMGNQFRQEVKLSSEKNLAGWNEPIVESVFLFDEKGNYYSEFYYALNYMDIANRNSICRETEREFRGKSAGSEDFFLKNKNGKMYFAYVLYDDDMRDCGTVVFEINEDALIEPFDVVSGYEGAFWAYYNAEDTICSNRGLEQEDLTELEREPFDRKALLTVQGKEYRIVKKDSSMGWRIIAGIPENQAAVILYNSIKWYVFAMVSIILVGLIGFAYFTYKITRPMQEFAKKLGEVKEGNYNVKLPEYDDAEFYEISTTFNDMTEHINYLINQVYEKQISLKEMELKIFQTQMNPHFMFNVLNSISMQARMDGNEEVAGLLSSFSQLIRAKIYRNNNEKVVMKQELEYVEYYLHLQRFRFGDRLEYSLDLQDDKLLELYVPKFCIQLVVENAVVHGIEPKMEKGTVHVNIYEKESSLFIEVEDNGIGFDKDGYIPLPIVMEEESSSHNHIGLNNTGHIIKLMYGEKYGITVYSQKGAGTKICIHIPIDSKE
ncbi:MAG: sensor histidine kinase [Lachnospiraceae bacterium]|nr:sensor histidine kinase [Lachnospiraceae bacterium]